MLPNMRKVEDLGEFRQKLKSIKAENLEVLVWGSIQNVRTLAKAQVTAGIYNDRGFTISFHLDERLEDPVGKTLYFYCEEKHALFKGKVSRAGNKAIEVLLVGTPYLAEYREVPRFEFPNIQYFLDVSTYHEQKDNIRNHQVVLRDISPGGFSFTVSIQRAQRFQKGHKLVLNKVEKLDLPRPIVGKIAHVTVLDSYVGEGTDPDFNRLVMIGTKFDQVSPIISEIIQSL